MIEKISEIGAGLGIAGVWPEEIGQMLAGLRRVVVEQEVSQEGLLARGIQAQKRFSVIDQVKIAQQLDVELLSQGQSFVMATYFC